VTDTVRVRFAPSPTGHLHIGGARTAIYNWAFARHTGGTFVLRIEDTDPERSTEQNTQAILRAMAFLGLDYDEGPEVGGDYGPYFQTGRSGRYAAGLEQLKTTRHAYPCFCSAEELERKRESARARGGFAGYDRACRAISPSAAAARIAAGEPHVWRIKIPEDRGDITFCDAVRGDTTFPSDNVDDFVLARTDGSPTYNFAVVMDDVDMKISHVIRGDDHLSNTPKQIVVYEALGVEVPTFAHLSMIWGPDGKRLSKRHGATSVEAYAEMGYLPEAIVNYLSLLGWSLDGETTIIDAETLIANFSLDRISRNPAIFDIEKLDWIDGVYIRELSPQQLVARMVPWLEKAGLATGDDVAAYGEWFLRLAPLVAERTKHLDEIAPMVRFLFGDIEIDPDARAKILSKDGAGPAIDAAIEALTKVHPFEHTAIENALREVPDRLRAKQKLVFQTIRVAVTGSTVSLPLFESLELLGRERTLWRLQAARTLATD
jgi:glutamyl-tRNA synthetase